VCEKRDLQPTAFSVRQKKLFDEKAAVFDQVRARPEKDCLCGWATGIITVDLGGGQGSGGKL